MATTSFAFAFAFASANPMAETVVDSYPTTELTAKVDEAGASEFNLTAPDAIPTVDVDAPPVVSSPATSEPTTSEPIPGEDDFLTEELKKQDDPLEGFNRLTFKLFWAGDKILIRPVAMAWRAVVPKPLRDGAGNALSNLQEPVVFGNDLLQLRPKRALRTLARFLINTTLGLGGLFDVAKKKPFNIKYHANGIGSTLGYYGVKPGPYLFLIYFPTTGPTTLRDLLDFPQGWLLPKGIGHPFNTTAFDLSSQAVEGLNERERQDAEIKAMFSDAVDRYATFRTNFLQNREGEIAELKAKDGEEPKGTELVDPLQDPAPAPSISAPPTAAPADPLPEPSATSSPSVSQLIERPGDQWQAEKHIAQTQNQPQRQTLRRAHPKHQTRSHQARLLRNQPRRNKEQDRPPGISRTFHRDGRIECQFISQCPGTHPQLQAAHYPSQKMQQYRGGKPPSLFARFFSQLAPFLAKLAGQRLI
jgi:phospholipid-binding lipoprotein MlaA